MFFLRYIRNTFYALCLSVRFFSTEDWRQSLRSTAWRQLETIPNGVLISKCLGSYFVPRMH